MATILPPVKIASAFKPGSKILYIGAYGFEDRSIGWVLAQRGFQTSISKALLINYFPNKGPNKVKELNSSLTFLANPEVVRLNFDPHLRIQTEDSVGEAIKKAIAGMDECVLDISAMTKLLLLICLCKLSEFTGTVRIVYTDAQNYAPTQREYLSSKDELSLIATYPTSGVSAIIRTRCLGSSRMQGQPVCLVAFTSFNEQLVRQMLGSISPYRLILINGRPPDVDLMWREKAAQEIHSKLIEDFSSANETGDDGLLRRVVSALDYRETVSCLHKIYNDFGTYERILCAATGGKMQTVGVFFAKVMHPDIHIEYPSPDSYIIPNYSSGIRNVYEVLVPRFNSFLSSLHQSST